VNLVFASKNEAKVSEIRALLPEGYTLRSLNDMGWNKDIEETGNTFYENARIKAVQVFQATGVPCFADDSGLEVTALAGRPGVFSARYAGHEKNDQKNNEKLLRELAVFQDRSATFKTVIAYCCSDGVRFFSGEIKGRIIHEFRGNMGFGYDPLFVPVGWEKTFAEVSKDEKNKASHRAMAFEQLMHFLKSVDK